MTEFEFAQRLLAAGQIHEEGPCFFCNAESCAFFKAWLAGNDPSGIAHTVPICSARRVRGERERCRRAANHQGEHESAAGRWVALARVVAIPPAGAFCDHTAMVECCDGCGHFACPCGVNWDEGSEGGFFETYEGEFE